MIWATSFYYLYFKTLKVFANLENQLCVRVYNSYVCLVL